MRIIFCNIAYMKNYCGCDGDTLIHGGKYIAENKEGGEMWNFLDYDGKCCGYFMHYGDILHIERIENTTRTDDMAEDVLVVWVAKPKNKNSVIVGWYRHAKVYKYNQTDLPYNYGYNIVADANNCHLLPENKRNFVIPRASKSGAGKGMGQSAIWYADSEYAKKEFVPKVIEYIDNYEKNDGEFINKVWTEKELNKKYIGDKDDSELLKLAKDVNVSPEKALLYINASLEYGETQDKLHTKADVLRELFQFTRAVPYYEKAYSLDNSDFELLSKLFEVYALTEQTEKAVKTGEILEKSEYFADYTPDDKIIFYNTMGTGYEELNLITLSENYFKKAEKLGK
ncbi:MAG: hypothetical protein K2J08_01385 [Ruminococcus sp.]|nr:hypothetical protein [Ruminococcus sp.]